MYKHHSHKDREVLRKTLRKKQTPQEIILWSRLRRSQLGVKFRRQHSIGKYIVDFYCPAKNLIIELDGSGHKSKPSIEYDQKRTDYLEGLDQTVLRFNNNDIDQNLKNCISHIETFLQ